MATWVQCNMTELAHGGIQIYPPLGEYLISDLGDFVSHWGVYTPQMGNSIGEYTLPNGDSQLEHTTIQSQCRLPIGYISQSRPAIGTNTLANGDSPVGRVPSSIVPNARYGCSMLSRRACGCCLLVS